jgi:membrane protein
VHDDLAGAIVTALLLQLISLASGFIYEKMTRLSVVYGSLTTALVFLYSVYLYASALLFGAEVAAAWSRPQTAHEPIGIQVRDAVRRIFVSQKRSPRPTRAARDE